MNRPLAIRAKRHERLFKLASALLAVTAALGLIWESYLGKDFVIAVFIFGLAALTAALTAFGVFSYLESDKGPSQTAGSQEGASNRDGQRPNDARTGTGAHPALDSLEKRIYPLLDKIEGGEKRLQVELLLEQVRIALRRLNRNLELLSKRGNANLVIGALIAVIGILVLAVSIYLSTSRQVTELNHLLNYVPSASFVILLEALAYFFLRMYRDAIADGKYFSNEISTLEARYLALIVASLDRNQDAYLEVIKALAGLERNVVLSTGQSTPEIERLRVEKQSHDRLIDKLSELVKRK